MLHGIDRTLELAGWLLAGALLIMLFIGPQLVAEDKPAADAADGDVVFTGTCGSCHTLAAAGTKGTLGPKLDNTSLDASKIEGVVRDGTGRMPGFSGALSDGEVAAVAAFVANAKAGGGGGGGGDGTQPAAPDGKSVFAGTCGSCHTLTAAGTSGSVGPNLDGHLARCRCDRGHRARRHRHDAVVRGEALGRRDQGRGGVRRGPVERIRMRAPRG